MNLNFLDGTIDTGKIFAEVKPYFQAVCGLLLFALFAFTIFKIIILAKDLAAAGDDPQRRSEIKKGFMYTLIAPVIGIAASGVILAIVSAFHGNGGGL